MNIDVRRYQNDRDFSNRCGIAVGITNNCPNRVVIYLKIRRNYEKVFIPFNALWSSKFNGR